MLVVTVVSVTIHCIWIWGSTDCISNVLLKGTLGENEEVMTIRCVGPHMCVL